jgi:transposase, IS30 family
MHADIASVLDMPVFFCEKASPWQRPSNENTNGLLRDYFPKAPICACTTPTGSPRSRPR